MLAELRDVTLRDLASGIRLVGNDDGFPLESIPPRGQVVVEFGTGTRIELTADIDEFKAAQQAASPVRGQH